MLELSTWRLLLLRFLLNPLKNKMKRDEKLDRLDCEIKKRNISLSDYFILHPFYNLVLSFKDLGVG